MMNDWRDPPQPYTVENNNRSTKLVAAAIVALGFIGAGTFAYESGTRNSQPVQPVASKAVASSDSANTAPAPDALPGGPTPGSLIGPAEPLKTADNAPHAAAPADSAAAAKPVKVARVQRQTPAARDTASSKPETKAPEAAPPAATPEPAVQQAGAIAPAEAKPAESSAPAEAGPAETAAAP
jgi:hypothetical protein